MSEPVATIANLLRAQGALLHRLDRLEAAITAARLQLPDPTPEFSDA